MKKKNPFWDDSMTEEEKLKQKQIDAGKQSWRDKKKREKEKDILKARYEKLIKKKAKGFELDR